MVEAWYSSHSESWLCERWGIGSALDLLSLAHETIYTGNNSLTLHHQVHFHINTGREITSVFCVSANFKINVLVSVSYHRLHKLIWFLFCLSRGKNEPWTQSTCWKTCINENNENKTTNTQVSLVLWTLNLRIFATPKHVNLHLFFT
jgi:hypothetical protein